MTRRFFLKQLVGVAPLLALGSFSFASQGSYLRLAWGGVEKIKKSQEEWQGLLSPEAYNVLFKENTERQFSSHLNNEKRVGIFLCAACYNPLFSSEAKFNSGTGWPSFFRAIEGHTETKRDFKMILPRTEYHCIRCGGHQGHLFDDGPKPTGQRWCNNGVALLFVPKGESLPPLRA